MGACRSVRDAMRVPISEWPADSISVKPTAECLAAKASAMFDKLRPRPWQAQVEDCFARQAEGKIETRDPRAFASQPLLEGFPIRAFFDCLQIKPEFRQSASGNSEGLAGRGAAGEIHTVYSPGRQR
jgi:hypothetical protein